MFKTLAVFKSMPVILEATFLTQWFNFPLWSKWKIALVPGEVNGSVVCESQVQRSGQEKI